MSRVAVIEKSYQALASVEPPRFIVSMRTRCLLTPLEMIPIYKLNVCFPTI